MDTRIRLIVEGQGVNETTIDLKELLNVQRELVKATNDLRLATEKKSSDSVKATKEEIGIINNLKSSIAELTRLRDSSLNTSDVQRYNSQLKSQQDELSKLTSIQKQQTVLSKEQNAQIQALTANTGQSNSMFKTLLTTMGALFAVDKVLEYSKAMLDNTINTQRLDIALKNISASNADYSASMEFLNKTSDKYGQNVNNLKESYIQFIAASKNSNLSMIERQKIYESVIQAGSTLQLSSEKVERALNAVSQMFSKGNVSAEELRQQLGEHIPGAFGMMAQALGVNEKKLNKMLEQGEVLAKDALPKLGKVLTETYGEKAQSNLETVAGQQNRALNSLTEWLKRKNEDLGVTNKISGAYKYLADNFDSLINVITSLSAVIALNTARKVASNAVDQIKLINLGREVLAKQAASTVTLELTAAETAAAAAATKFNSALSAAPWGIFLTIGAAALTFLLDYTDAQRRFYELSEEGVKTTDESIKMEKAHGIELGNNIESIKKLAYGNEERIRKVNELMKQYPQYFQNLTAEQVSNWHLKNAYEMVNKEIQTKITLMAREKSIEKTTDRLATIKMELESMGVMVNSVQEYYKVQKEQGSWFALNAPKATALLREQAKLEDQLRTTSYKLSDAKINQMNVELRANKAMYESKQITLEQFKTEANRIQDTYGIKVKYYNLEKEEPPKVTGIKDSEKKKQEKLADEQLKRDIERFNELYDIAQEAFKEHLSVMKELEEKQLKERKDNQKEYQDTVEKIQKNIEKIEEESAESSRKITSELNTWKINKFAQLNETILKNQKKSDKEYEDFLNNKKNTWENILNTTISDTAIASGKISEIFKSIDIGEFLANNLDEISNLLSKAQDKLDKIIEETTDNTKKANAQLSKEMIKPWEESVNAAKSLLSGDLVGTATGIFGHLKGMWNMTFGLKNTLADIRHDDFQSWYQSNIDSLNNFQDKIKSTFGDLFTDTIQLSTEIDNSTTGRINAEIKIGEQIKANYEKAVEEENKLYNTKIDNINKEYAYKDMKALQELGIATLNIKQKMNEDLLAFITNEDTKASLQSDYLEKRNIVIAAYADKIKPISEGMSDAEIEGIKAAEKARDEALANVEDWLTTEFQFIFSNEEQKRKEYSETEKIILQGQEDINTLKIKFQADEIERNKQKNIEIETAYEDHMKVLGKLEDDKNVAMLASFNSMKDAMISGLRELEAAANRAYNEGIINLDEYTKRLDDILRIRGLLGIPLRTPYKPDNTGGDNTNNYDNYNPQSEQAYVVGTEYVDRENKFPDGIDTVKAKLTKGEAVLTKAVNKKKLDAGLTNIKAIEYAVNFKSMLDNPGFMPLQLKSSILPKLEERAAMQYLLNMNMVPVIDKLNDVEKALSKIPIQNFTLDENGLNKFVKKGNSVQKLRKKRFE